ncbi:VWA domain-containing protein [Elusimicrobiota bacterium]
MFENKEFLILFFLIPFAGFFLFYFYHKKKKDILKFMSLKMFNETTGINLNRYKLKNILLLCSMVFIIIALSNPKFGVKTIVVSKKAATIVIVMDVSKSMLAQDLKPNRLEIAKASLSNLIAGFKGNKIGIIVFAGSAFWKCPITADVISANNFLNTINTGDVPLGGTKISKALDLALNSTVDIPEGAKAIILVTDGEDDDSGLHVLIEKAKKHKTKIYTIGIGNTQGTKIPLENNEYMKDDKGDTVITRLDEETLQYISDETGGEYINLSESRDSLFKILQIAHSLDKSKDEISKEVKREEQYQIFLFIAFVLFCISFYLSVFKREGKNE